MNSRVKYITFVTNNNYCEIILSGLQQKKKVCKTLTRLLISVYPDPLNGLE